MMDNYKVVTVVIVAGFVAMATLATAGAPHLISHQGRLIEPGGNPVVDDTYSMVFSFYNFSLGGSPLWSETQNVVVADGLFSVLLGTINPIPDSAFAGMEVYLGVSIGGDPELAPRTRLVSVGYSLRVASVDGAGGGRITSKVSIGSGHSNPGANSFVAGLNNTAGGDESTIGGGMQNTAGGYLATIGGGYNNVASTLGATVAGGTSDTASGVESAVGGGTGNHASGYLATIAGGAENVASGERSTVAGGYRNTVNGVLSAVVGGYENLASSYGASVGGGYYDSATAQYATVGGGAYNSASGMRATIPGGEGNTAAGVSSFAAGYNAKALHGGAFVWADSTDSDFTSTGGNQFLIRASGGVGINTNAPAAGLDVNGDICYSGSIGACSDRRYKKDVRSIDDALEKIARLQGVTFKWKRDEFPDREFDDFIHLGFIAQDIELTFPELVMTDSEGYKSVDYGRLTPALVEAIKKQQQQIMKQQQQISQLQTLVMELLTQNNTQASVSAIR